MHFWLKWLFSSLYGHVVGWTLFQTFASLNQLNLHWINDEKDPASIDLIYYELYLFTSCEYDKQKMFLPHPRVKLSIVGSLRDREVACSASDRQGSSFESCVWRTVSSHSSHHPQEVLLAQFSLYVHKGGLKPIHFICEYDWSLVRYIFGAFVIIIDLCDIICSNSNVLWMFTSVVIIR